MTISRIGVTVRRIRVSLIRRQRACRPVSRLDDGEEVGKVAGLACKEEWTLKRYSEK